MTNYFTVSELKRWVGVENDANDDLLASVATAAKLWVDSRCGRRFDADTAATARVFHPVNEFLVEIDDTWSITSIATDDADTGAYATTWAATDYQTYPLNTIGGNAASNWPTNRLVAIASREWPILARPSVKVTAKWGWTSVPADVKTAALLVGSRVFSLRNTPLGLSGGTLDIGPVPVRDLRDIDNLLAPYKAQTSSDGRFLIG